MTAYVLHSGGLDSTATLLSAIETHGIDNVIPVSINYGQRHVRELDAAEAIHYALGINQAITLDTSGALHHGPSLVEGGAVPHGHYAEESMRATVVQGRNLFFVSLLVGLTHEGDEAWIGVHGGDHFIYPDCRPSFVTPLGEAIRHAYGVALIAPFINADKTAVAATFADHPQIAELTWSCYEGNQIHCGRCGTCVERAEAFYLADVHDPTPYADPDFWREAVAAHAAAND